MAREVEEGTSMVAGGGPFGKRRWRESHLCRDFSGHGTILSFSLRPSNSRVIPLFFLTLLQPRSMELAEFLLISK